MTPALAVDGPTYRLRPVGLSDAAAILALRLDPRNSRFIHATSPALEDQRRWLAARLGDDTDLTFVLETNGTSRVVGAFSVYDIDASLGHARYGRWLTAPFDRRCVAEFALLGYTMIFERLGLERVHALIPEGHATAHAFQQRIGAERQEDHREWSDLESGRHLLVEYRVRRRDWPRIRAQLLDLVTARIRHPPAAPTS